MDVKLVNLSHLEDHVVVSSENNNNDISKSEAGRLETSLFSKPVVEKVTYLRKINATFVPGAMTAIIGTGLSPNILLRHVARRCYRGCGSGMVLLNGKKREHGVYGDIVYMSGLDMDQVRHFDQLRIFDLLYYTAKLRTKISDIDCRNKVRDIVRLINIDGTLKVELLSVLEVRLLTIAMELMGDPSLLCIESPAHGIDSIGAMEIIRVIKAISERQNPATTVICTLDGLCGSALVHINHYMILAKQQLAYSGVIDTEEKREIISRIAIKISAVDTQTYDGRGNGVDNRSRWHWKWSSLLPFFDSSSSSSSSDKGNMNQSTSSVSEAEHSRKHHEQMVKKVEKLVIHETKTLSQLKATTKRDRFYGETRRSHNVRSSEIKQKAPKNVVGFWQQTFTLTKRNLEFLVRNRYQMRMTFGRLLLGGLLVGLTAYQVGNTDHDYDDDFSNYSLFEYHSDALYTERSCLFAILLLSVMQMTFPIKLMHSHALMLHSEIKCGIYSPLSAWIALACVEFPIYTMSAFICGILVSALLGLHFDSSAFLGTIILHALCAYSLASLCAVSLPTYEQATSYFAIISAFVLLFSGYFYPLDETSTLWWWATEFSYTRWAFQSLLLEDYDKANDSAYIEALGFDPDLPNETSLRNLSLWFVVCQLLVIVQLMPRRYKVKSVSVETFQEADELNTAANENGVENNESAYTPPTVDNIIIQSSDRNTDKNHNSHNHSSGIESSELDEFEVNSDNTSVISLGSSQREEATELAHFDFPVVAIQPNVICNLTFRRVKFTYAGGFHAPFTVLSGVTGNLTPASSCCILNGQANGAGRLLMRLLSGRMHDVRSTDTLEGEIYANGHFVMNGDTKHILSAYVPVGDAKVWSCLTVEETLRYAMEMRLGAIISTTNVSNSINDGGNSYSSMSSIAHGYDKSDAFMERHHAEVKTCNGESVTLKASKEERIREIIFMFNLTSVKHTRIGENGCNLSGSQMRLLTIGMELLTRPGLVCLEDPIRDLNWIDSCEVAAAITALRRGGRTVICTLSKPSPPVFSSFDTCLLLGNGMPLYFGSCEEAFPYFDRVGFYRSEKQSVIEFLLDIAGDKGVMKDARAGSTGHKVKGTHKTIMSYSLEDLHDLHRSMTLTSQSFSSLRSSMPRKDKPLPSAPRLPTITSTTLTLWKRCRRVLFSDEAMLLNFILRALIAGVLLGSVWYSVAEEQIFARVNLLVCAYAVLNLVFVDLFHLIFTGKSIFWRELDVGCTRLESFWITDDLPWQVLNWVSSIIFIGPLYGIGGLRVGGEYFFIFFVLTIASLYCNLELAYLISVVYSDPWTARIIYSGVVMPLQYLYSGALVLLSTMEPGFAWLAYINPMSFYLAGTLRNEFKGNLGTDDTTWKELLDFYGYSVDTTESFFCLICIGMVLRALRLLYLQIRLPRQLGVFRSVGSHGNENRIKRGGRGNDIGGATQRGSWSLLGTTRRGMSQRSTKESIESNRDTVMEMTNKSNMKVDVVKGTSTTNPIGNSNDSGYDTSPELKNIRRTSWGKEREDDFDRVASFNNNLYDDDGISPFAASANSGTFAQLPMPFIGNSNSSSSGASAGSSYANRRRSSGNNSIRAMRASMSVDDHYHPM